MLVESIVLINRTIGLIVLLGTTDSRGLASTSPNGASLFHTDRSVARRGCGTVATPRDRLTFRIGWHTPDGEEQSRLAQVSDGDTYPWAPAPAVELAFLIVGK